MAHAAGSNSTARAQEKQRTISEIQLKVPKQIGLALPTEEPKAHLSPAHRPRKYTLASGSKMAPSEKPKAKNQKPTEEEIAAIASDVANFASSIGLAPAHLSSSSGFDDSDFRKSGPVQPSADFDEDEDVDDDVPVAKPVPADAKPKPKPKPHPLTLAPPTANKFDNLPKLPLVKASALSGAWYVDADEIEIRVLGADGRDKKVESVTGVVELKELVTKKKELGERLMMQYVKDYEMGRKRNGDVRLLETTTRSGTSADKVSAFACLVEDNPIANFRALDALLSMVTSKVGKRYAFTGFEALKDIFLLRLLPDRKLKYLIQRPLDKLPETKDGYSLLLFWHWEECLKQRYERFVIALEEALKDMLPSLKDKAMKAVYTLLKSKSEQERRLLSALVNKLGDPERKAASNAAYQLSCLLSAHPNMKAVVIEEVDSFVFRPHIGLRAKYYAVNFLSQIFLTRKGDGPKTAKRLLDLYFALFKVLISDSVSRGGKKYNKKDKERGKNNKKHGKNDNEEPHVEMDSRLLSILLTGVNRAFPYVSSDEADDIVESQTPILYRLVHSENFNVGVQALMLLCQISSKNQFASDRFYRALYAKLLTPAAVNSSKPEMFLGLLVKAMRSDLNFKRVAAFAKRLLQVALQRPPQYACGCLFMISEVLKAKPPLWTMVLQKEMVDDEIEHFTDVVDDPDGANDPPLNKAVSQDENELAISKQVNEKNNGLTQKNIKNEKDQESHEGSLLPASYNPRHREPSYCNADRASWWELAVLASHVHPSVATMAQTLLSGAHIVYNGDPLNDLSLAAFLDKLMEKKPKPNKKAEGRWHGGSQIAPVGKLEMSHSLIGEEILTLAEEDVPPEDIVFHRFYANKTTSKKKLKKKKKAQDNDGNDVLASDDEEEAIGNMSDDDEDEIDDVLGSGVIDDDPSSENYDYDDLDKVIDEDDDDDEDLINFDDDDTIVNKDEDDDEKEDIGNVMDSEDDEAASSKKKKKEKKGEKEEKKKKKKSRVSPFVSMEEYEHLITTDDKVTSKFPKRRKMKKQ